jgi:hypothetical protein
MNRDKIGINQNKIINFIHKMKHQWRSTISDKNGVINVKDKAIWQEIRTANEIHNLSRQGFGGPRQVSNSKNCWKCGQLGHLSKDCQNFKYRQNVHGNYVALSVTRVPERGIIT